jgi:ABC-type antimicrobial peptide transport system permease subunit
MQFTYRIILLALKALRRNILRSALTILGIEIGISSVITMMAIGQGSSTAVQKTIQSMGADNLLVMPGTASSGGVTFGSGSTPTLTSKNSDEIEKECPAVAEAAPIVRARTQVIYRNANWVPLYIYGTTPKFLKVRQWTDLDDGEPFTDQDVSSAALVCMLGQTLVKELFQGESPIGKEVRVQNVNLKVVGVLSQRGANMMGLDQDDILLAPLTTIKNRVANTSTSTVNQSQSANTTDPTQKVNSLNIQYPGTGITGLYLTPTATQAADTPQPVRFNNVDQILVRSKSTAEIPLAIRQITDLLHERHRIKPGQPDDFGIRDMTEMTKALSSTSTLMVNLLLCVALISLLVGGVGIMNIMLVSVTERTREIGLRMAVGARARDILRQFLVEAILLCLIGGAIGILMGLGSSLLVTWALRWPTEPSWLAVLAAVIVSATVGVVFGYYPAWKASRLDPIEALRYE